MNNRTLVKVEESAGFLHFRTISRQRKSIRFIITDREWVKFISEQSLISNDIANFAIFLLDKPTDTVTIRFYWLSTYDNGNVTGYNEIVKIRYSELVEALNNKKEYWALSIDNSNHRPHYIFNCREKLHSVLENEIVRRKFIRALRDKFRWPESKTITFYSDSMPYSFYFREERVDNYRGISGGLTFHCYSDNLSEGKYQIHT